MFRSALRPAATSSHSDFNTYVEKQHWLPASTSTPPPAESDRHDAVDFSEYICGSADDKRRVAGTLLDSLRQNGYARLRYHGIHASVVGEAFDLSRAFFAQPSEVKSTIAYPPQANPHRGYSYVGLEQGDAANLEDHKETLDIGPAHDSLHPNLWLPESHIPGFRDFMGSFFSSCNALSLSLLSALALSLNIAPEKLTSLHSRGENEFRLLHYPATLAASLAPGTGSTRFSAHKDSGTLTLLFQDASGGLEIEDQARTGQGIFHAVTNPPGVEFELILQVGDALQRLTNDGVKAGLRRVTVPPILTEYASGNDELDIDPSEVIAPERYSVAYFCQPDREASIGTLQDFVTEESPAKYESLTAMECNGQGQASTS